MVVLRLERILGMTIVLIDLPVRVDLFGIRSDKTVVDPVILDLALIMLPSLQPASVVRAGVLSLVPVVIRVGVPITSIFVVLEGVVTLPPAPAPSVVPLTAAALARPSTAARTGLSLRVAGLFVILLGSAIWLIIIE